MRAHALSGIARPGSDRSARITSGGLQLSPGAPLHEWVAVGRRLARVADGSAWSLGDWLLYGQATYGPRYRKALELTTLDYQTLRNYAWVARRIELSRRRDTLSFAHHAEVAALHPVEQDLWLQRAEFHRWTRAELRRRLGTHRRAHRGADPARIVFHVAVTAERELRWRQAAEGTELAVTEWLTMVADAAADQILISGGPSPAAPGRHVAAVAVAAR